MTETRTVHDPLLGKDVQISNALVDRLRGKYASGPTMPNGEPEFGWRHFETAPIQHEAAAEIERLRAALAPFAADKLPSPRRSEIDAHCVNCDSWAEAPARGIGICLKINEPTNLSDGCAKFFPDPKRWPDADHG